MASPTSVSTVDITTVSLIGVRGSSAGAPTEGVFRVGEKVPEAAPGATGAYEYICTAASPLTFREIGS